MASSSCGVVVKTRSAPSDTASPISRSASSGVSAWKYVFTETLSPRASARYAAPSAWPRVQALRSLVSDPVECLSHAQDTSRHIFVIAVQINDRTDRRAGQRHGSTDQIPYIDLVVRLDTDLRILILRRKIMAHILLHRITKIFKFHHRHSSLFLQRKRSWQIAVTLAHKVLIFCPPTAVCISLSFSPCGTFITSSCTRSSSSCSPEGSSGCRSAASFQMRLLPRLPRGSPLSADL